MSPGMMDETQSDLVVVKIGGAAGNDLEPLLEELARRGGYVGRLVLVHGGSAETDELAASLGVSVRRLHSPQGHESRDTTRPVLEVFTRATALVNRRLVEDLLGRGLDAFGASGLDGGLVRARRKSAARAVVEGRTVVVRDQWTGKIVSVRAGLLRSLLRMGVLPVIAPLAAGEAGEMLNVDGDRLAAALAVALGARRLVILTDVGGVLEDVDDPGSLMSWVEAEDFGRLRQAARGRMKKKILAAEEALRGGVDRVQIASSRGRDPLARALAGGGTTIAAAPLAEAGGLES